MFIVQGKPRSPEGILKVIKETRQEAMKAANDLLEHGMAFVTIIAEGACLYGRGVCSHHFGLRGTRTRHAQRRRLPPDGIHCDFETQNGVANVGWDASAFI